MRLPEPMLAKSGPLPDGPEWRFELKLDGFRAIVSTTGGLRVRSRRGWDMTALVPELADLPPRLTLDGELVAFGEDKLPSFPRLCERMLHRRPGIPVAYMIFDVLEHDGLATLNWPYGQRRELLEELNLHGSHWDTAMAFEDGERLFMSVQETGREGVVAKKLSHRYRPGERLWVKVKNRAYWRFPLEREAVRKRRRTPSMFTTR